MRKKRKPGRPKGTGVNLSEHLTYMADEICCRKFRSERDAARSALQRNREQVSERQLTRVYADNRRDLEIRAMRRLASWNIRFWWKGNVLCRSYEWEALLEHTERLAATNPRLRELAAELFPDAWPQRRLRPFPLHRLYPQELIDLLKEVGLQPPSS